MSQLVNHHSLIFISTQWKLFWERDFWDKNPWKKSVREFFFKRVGAATLLKINSFTHIFQGFWLRFPKLIYWKTSLEQLYFRKTFSDYLLMWLRKGQILNKPLRNWVYEKHVDQTIFLKNVVTGLQDLLFFLAASILSAWTCDVSNETQV